MKTLRFLDTFSMFPICFSCKMCPSCLGIGLASAVLTVAAVIARRWRKNLKPIQTEAKKPKTKELLRNCRKNSSMHQPYNLFFFFLSLSLLAFHALLQIRAFVKKDGNSRSQVFCLVERCFKYFFEFEVESAYLSKTGLSCKSK